MDVGTLFVNAPLGSADTMLAMGPGAEVGSAEVWIGATSTDEVLLRAGMGEACEECAEIVMF